MKRLALVAILTTFGVSWVVHPTSAGSTRASQIVHGDFDGDGKDDLAIGAPMEDDPNPATATDAGMVHIVYGTSTPNGVNTADNEVVHEGLALVKGEAENKDMFGNTMTTGDFDKDGFDDLAVGVMGQTVNGHQGAGAVHVFYGSADGIRDDSTQAVEDRIFTQDTKGVADKAESFQRCDNDDPPNCQETGDAFGSSLAAGDLNKDGFDDLAIGARVESIGRQRAAGAVNVLYGRSNGLTANGDQFWHEDVPGVAGQADDEELFGHHLAIGRFGKDGAADLAVGIPYKDIDGNIDAGSAHIFYGDVGRRLSATGDKVLSQALPGVAGDGAQGADFFGWALAAGDFDDDGFDDLAAGLPGESVGGENAAGAVMVFNGSKQGFGASASFWHQDSTDVDDVAEAGDSFGFSLAVGDFDNSGQADLAIGVPDQTVNAHPSAGAVAVLYGGGSGLMTANNDDLWTQDSSVQGAVDDSAEDDDRFGSNLAVGDYGGDGYVDLSIGVPDESVAVAGGLVEVMDGNMIGITDLGDQSFTQTSVGDVAEAGDEFGVFFMPACNDPQSLR